MGAVQSYFQNLYSIFDAVKNQDIAGCQILIDSKVDLNQTDKNGLTPLHIACIVGNIKICELLIKNGAKKTPIDIYSKTPLCYAVEQNRIDILKLFMDNGVVVEASFKTQ